MGIEDQVKELKARVDALEKIKIKEGSSMREQLKEKILTEKNAFTWLTFLILLFLSVAFLAINLILQYWSSSDRSFEMWNFIVFNTAVLFLAFLITFSGAVYMLRAVEVIYELFANKTRFKGSVSIGIPGLVMILVGVSLAAYTISYNPQTSKKVEGKGCDNYELTAGEKCRMAADLESTDGTTASADFQPTEVNVPAKLRPITKTETSITKTSTTYED